MVSKFYYTIIFLVVCGVQLSSQISVGLRGGYTKAWPDYGDTVLPEDAETDVEGYNFSFMIYTKVSPTVSLGVEPGIVQRGAACFPGWQPIFLGDTKVNVSMLEFPLLVRKEISMPKTKISIGGKIGYGLSYAVSGKETITPLEPNPQPIISDLDLNDPELMIKRWDHGIYSGLEARYQITNKHCLVLESNFYLGMHNIDKINYTKNRSLGFSLGYVYTL